MKVHLKRLRLERDGMTQQDLAVRIGVTRQTIIAIERGNYQPSVELALRLARVFGMPVEAIFELAEESEQSP
ncbi:MAG: helix-turn-helix transcriptional regulator [Pirellulales bacterium]|nr:helix-turn-helix transcriptional regulator [Pirellulales bacterium]MBX3432668.1 helix-turn-helix transcriptional regulator [Pirellulales bacterium]